MKKSQREIINVIALVIILIAAFSISNLFNKSIKEESKFQNIRNAALTGVSEKSAEAEEPEETEEPEELIYESEQFTDSIIVELSSLEEEEINLSPRVAFIIDDLGYETDVARKMIELEFPVALSVLPFLQFSQYIAEEGKKNNHEIMLHLPMEANNSSTNPGPGAIKLYMSEEEIRQAVRKCLSDFPYIVGTNNHMGSKVTEERKIMKIILEEIRESNIFFIDSITSKNSVAYIIAQEMGIKSAVRSIFLDNENDMDYIKGQMLKVQEAALKKGEVIAIGHSRINTFYVLKTMTPELIKAGIEIVPVSELVK